LSVRKRQYRSSYPSITSRDSVVVPGSGIDGIICGFPLNAIFADQNSAKTQF
jgi:hypothetical protein